jgi:hypothetical protein
MYAYKTARQVNYDLDNFNFGNYNRKPRIKAFEK